MEVTQYEREVAEALVEEAAKELPGLGVEVVTLTPEERARFRDAAQPAVLEQVRATLGDKAVDDWLSAVGHQSNERCGPIAGPHARQSTPWMARNRLIRLLEAAVSGGVYAMTGVLVLQVFCRYALDASLSWSEELSRYLMIWIAMLGTVAVLYGFVVAGLLFRRLNAPTVLAMGLNVGRSLGELMLIIGASNESRRSYARDRLPAVPSLRESVKFGVWARRAGRRCSSYRGAQDPGWTCDRICRPDRRISRPRFRRIRSGTGAPKTGSRRASVRGPASDGSRPILRDEMNRKYKYSQEKSYIHEPTTLSNTIPKLYCENVLK